VSVLIKESELPLELTPEAALALEHAHFRRLLATRDHKRAVEAFFERRTAVFTGE